MRGVRLIKRPTQDREGALMKLTFAISTSQSCGSTFRLDFGIAIPVVLVVAFTALLS